MKNGWKNVCIYENVTNIPQFVVVITFLGMILLLFESLRYGIIFVIHLFELMPSSQLLQSRRYSHCNQQPSFSDFHKLGIIGLIRVISLNIMSKGQFIHIYIFFKKHKKKTKKQRNSVRVFITLEISFLFFFPFFFFKFSGIN